MKKLIIQSLCYTIFYMKTNTLQDFHIYSSVPLIVGSVVRSCVNFRVESKIDLIYLRDFFLEKKTSLDISDWLHFSLSSIFSKWLFLLWVSGQWKVNVTKYEVIIHEWLEHLMQNNFYKGNATWKFIISKLFWNTCWTCYINIYAYLFDSHECKYCLSQSLWAIPIY